MQTDWKERKLSLFADDVIINVENPKEFTKNFEKNWVLQGRRISNQQTKINRICIY